jgi:hypothetical protein
MEMNAILWGRSLRRFFTTHWRSLLLAALIIVQFSFLAKNYIVFHLAFTPERLPMNSIDRSGVSVFGDEGYAYMRFVRESTPPDAKIIIPDVRPDKDRDIEAMWHVRGVVQHFLMPRKITSCPCHGRNEKCIPCVEQPGFYVLSIGDYPPVQGSIPGKDFLPFAEGDGFFKGLFVPAEGAGE